MVHAWRMYGKRIGANFKRITYNDTLPWFSSDFYGKKIEMADQLQRSRSVYIGNLPWDIKEDDLKEVFARVGTIVSLRMPNDPESGKSRGFAFCEYRDQESVNVAIKHFNGYELLGRKIRVDSAANNQDKDAKIVGPPPVDNQFGEACDPVEAPERIASIVGKMSPQQIQALVSDTRRSLQTDPEEARVALVNNPQLVYAILLALVRGRYVTKERGTEALTKQEPPLLPLFPEARPAAVPSLVSPIPSLTSGPSLLGPSPGVPMPGTIPPMMGSGSMAPAFGNPPLGPPQPFHPGLAVPPPQNYGHPPMNMNMPPPHMQPDHLHHGQREPGFERERPSGLRGTMRDRPNRASRPDGERDAFRDGGSGRHGNREGANRGRGAQGPYQDNRDRQRFPPTTGNGSAKQSPRTPNSPAQQSPSTSKEEQEKAELIMQVLRLREDDIAKMAPEQQKTVRMLRDQFKNISK
ncbi:cleavage stimulation factor subunit 2 tau variant-like isoform X2 [Paramacrobiotus metropolitanus]|uniref:cleavage stimulation factor subunit 2 tau variant-like isoform X2 n=1 Tax=Paramacrobiotus metropolitanus TaxID=2943436 RepID=UPI0024462463|nr:cleavage stimulation factor subunit 2 tau variant-like isoform X2 [Paramacrobiotus metropolitanus]